MVGFQRVSDHNEQMDFPGACDFFTTKVKGRRRGAGSAAIQTRSSLWTQSGSLISACDHQPKTGKEGKQWHNVFLRRLSQEEAKEWDLCLLKLGDNEVDEEGNVLVIDDGDFSHLTY